MVPLEPRVPGEVAPLDPPALQIIKRAPSPGADSGKISTALTGRRGTHPRTSTSAPHAIVWAKSPTPLTKKFGKDQRAAGAARGADDLKRLSNRLHPQNGLGRFTLAAILIGDEHPYP
jgi:hypothetical protein